MGNFNFCSDLTRVKAVLLIQHAVPAVRCTSPGLKKSKKSNIFANPDLYNFDWRFSNTEMGRERRGDWPQESVQKFDCKMPRYNILYIDTEPSHLSQTFCCINSQSELFIQYKLWKLKYIQIKCFSFSETETYQKVWLRRHLKFSMQHNSKYGGRKIWELFWEKSFF